MMKLFLILTVLFWANAERVTFDNHKVYGVTPNTDEEVRLLEEIAEDGLSLWDAGAAKGREAKVMVSPEKHDTFLYRFGNTTAGVELKIEDVQRLIDSHRTNTDRSSTFDWTRYHSLDAIYNWLDSLAETYPNIVTVVEMGTSVEGRVIKGVVIDYQQGQRTNPVSGMIEGGIHAREWITPATATWVINEFLTSSDPAIRSMAENVVWHIFPVVNPDGYVYTFTTNRMWRKNRNVAYNTTCSSSDDMSRGVDLNRNFPYQWMTIGASQDPCAETYAGPTAASEPETRAIANYVLGVQQESNLLFYYALHSYTQLLLIPYSHVVGYEKLQRRNYGDLHEIASRGAAKLQERYGMIYLVGVSNEILYAVSGSSMDWAAAEAEVPISMLIELRDLGQYGFLLPPEEIIPNNLEMMDCLVEMDRTARQIGYYNV